MSFKFSLGEKVKDTVTGFSGIVTARTEWLNGCKRYGVQSQKLKDNKPLDQQWFDEEQLTAAGNGIKAVQRMTGGPRPAPMRAADPRR